ncbi:unnamed protein product [Spirodela intermedia]|uniref:DUF7851 domain-containing protein n=1 Tax=Spirodela intermedia TaxID=51605 RepID=A0A7I8ICA2_SPIIN|nr:unnamed protein product [Spirodela intermedia]CAA6654973.1 unnamed protein product [Spirodela intermedia]
MEEKEKKKKQKQKQKQTQTQTQTQTQRQSSRPAPEGTTAPAADPHFKASADVKGHFTVRRAGALELLRLISVAPPQRSPLPFPSTTAYVPTSFTVLAHEAWHTLTLGLGTRKSKVLLFVFDSEGMKAAVDRLWPALIRGIAGCEMARFKFRKGALTFYVYAADDLRTLLESVVALKDFLDHTAMLAQPSQRSITFNPPVAVAH